MSTGFPLHRYTYQEYVRLEQATVRKTSIEGRSSRTTSGSRNVVVISHREPRADVWFRASEAEPWSHTEIASGRVELAAIQCALDVDAVWRAAREPA